MYIVFEGVVGTGKTTQSKMLVEHLQKKYPEKEVIWTREPGGSEIADAIRKLVQGTPFTEKMDPVCEAYLYASSRAQSLRSIVRPCLEKGGIVVADRSVFSSVSWQGFGRGIGKEMILKINESAVEGLLPDHIVYLYGNIESMMQRTFDASGDKFESFSKDFFLSCEEGYADLAKDERFARIWKSISAMGTKEEVFQKILNCLSLS